MTTIEKKFLQCIRQNEGKRRLTIIKEFVGRAGTRQEQELRRQCAYELVWKLSREGVIEFRTTSDKSTPASETIHMVRTPANE